MSQSTGCLGIVFKLLGIAPRTGGKVEYPYGLRDAFLSPAELSFHHVLRGVLPPGLSIAPKVRLADLLFVRQPHRNQAARNRVQQKHVDFVLCDVATMQPRLVIELDDASHEKEDRKARDSFVDGALGAAGLPIWHVKAARAYSADQLRAQLLQALAVTNELNHE